MSVIANELSNSLESLLLSDTKTIKENKNSMEQKQTGNYFILDHEPSGSVASSPRYSSNTDAVSIPYPSKYYRNARIRIGNTNSPSSSISSSNGSLSRQNLKESLNKTINSLIENCQEKVIIYKSSPSSSYSFTKHSTIIYSPSKINKIISPTIKTIPSTLSKSPLSKSKRNQNNLFTKKKIKPTLLNQESKLSEITFGLQNKVQPFDKSLSDDDTSIKVEVKPKEEKIEKKVEKKEELKVEEIKKEVEKEETAREVINTESKKESIPDVVKKTTETKETELKPIDKPKSMAKIESEKEKAILKKKKGKTHKKALSLPSMLTPLTPLSGMEENSPPPETRKRRKSVNFSADTFKSICVFTTTDKPESIKNAKIEVKIDDPERDLKDKEFSELRGYESAWSPVPRNVIHIQKFKSSKAKHVQYELPVSVQSFKLVKGDPEETEDKLTCLEVTLNVQNLNYHKKVVIRYSTNKWKSFKEVEAKYDKCIREATKDEADIKGVVGLDSFVARIPVGEHFVLKEKPGHICNQRPTKMLLVARYEVNNNTYWDNNDFTDYHIELVRINAGYDVPRVSKHGKPIPCPGCSMDAKEHHIMEKKGKEIKNNRRTVRKIGGVFGNFTDAVTKNNDPTNFMADKNKINLYMGMDGTGKTATSTPSESNLTEKLTEEPQKITSEEITSDTPSSPSPKKAIPSKKKKNSYDRRMHPTDYTFGSPSMVGSPMFSTLGNYTMGATTTTMDTNTSTSPLTSSSTSTIPAYSGESTSKYDPPMSTTSSLYPGASMTTTTTTSYTPSTYATGPSKYELSPYSGGVSYDPSAYGNYPTTTATTTTTTSHTTSTTTPSYPTSKYDIPNSTTSTFTSKYDIPNSTTSTFTSKYDIPNSTVPTTNPSSKYDIPNSTTSTFTSKYDIPNSTTPTVTSKYDIPNSTTPTVTSKYDPPSGYSSTSFATYDPQHYQPSRSYSTPLSTPSAYDPFGTSSPSNASPIQTSYSQFSDYNF